MNLLINLTNDITSKSNTFELVTRLNAIRLLKPIQKISMATMLIGAICMIQHYPFGGEIAFLSKIILSASTFLIFIFTKPKSYGHWAAFIGLVLFIAINLNIDAIDAISKYLMVLISICIVIYYWDIGMNDGTVVTLGVDNEGEKIQEITLMACLGFLILGLILKLNDSSLAVLSFGIGVIFGIVWAALYFRKLGRKG